MVTINSYMVILVCDFACLMAKMRTAIALAVLLDSGQCCSSLYCDNG